MSSLGELVQHPLLVLHVVSQASELLLMSLPLVLQLLLHTFLQGGNTPSCQRQPPPPTLRVTRPHLDVSVRPPDVLLLLP